VALDALIIRFGLPAVLVGAGIEGEPFAIAGGFLAHRHLLPLGGAMLAAGIGAVAIDQMWFLAGRYARRSRWVRGATERPVFAKMLGLIERHPAPAILSFRFAYGVRAVAPVAVGASQVPAAHYVLLNLLAAAVWAPAFTLAGYLFGRSIDRLSPAAAPVGLIVGACVSIGVALAIFVRRKSR
jgi:membrane protein DedA with SNARE-associated domain